MPNELLLARWALPFPRTGGVRNARREISGRLSFRSRATTYFPFSGAIELKQSLLLGAQASPPARVHHQALGFEAGRRGRLRSQQLRSLWC